MLGLYQILLSQVYFHEMESLTQASLLREDCGGNHSAGLGLRHGGSVIVQWSALAILEPFGTQIIANRSELFLFLFVKLAFGFSLDV